MKCPNCKGKLYLNQKEITLQCPNCKWKNDRKKIFNDSDFVTYGDWKELGEVPEESVITWRGIAFCTIDNKAHLLLEYHPNPKKEYCAPLMLWSITEESSISYNVNGEKNIYIKKKLKE